MNIDIKTALQEWGLNEKETEVYLFLIKNGSNSANEIAKSTGILRQTIYEIIDKLELKGLINEITINKKKYFEATPPNKLQTILEEKKKIIDSIMPSLEALGKSKKSSSKTRVYLGKNGLKMVLRDPLTSKTEIKAIHPSYSEKFFQEFFIQNFSVSRIHKKIPIKILRGKVDTDFQKEVSMTDKKKLREVKLLSDLENIKASFIQYNNKITMINYNEDNPFAVMIEDESISASFQIIYNSLWDKGKKI